MNNFVGTNADTAFCKTEKTRFQAFFFFSRKITNTHERALSKLYFFGKKVNIEKMSVTAFCLGTAELLRGWRRLRQTFFYFLIKYA